MNLIHATTPADLGPRATLLVDKHAAYIQGFARIWEVCGGIAVIHVVRTRRCTS